MGDAILQGFLNRGLINVDGDDAKLEKLIHAAKDLAEILKKAPAKALGFSLIAFDPEAPEDDPAVQEALAALQARWATYRNTFSTTPVAVIRAMLLDALVTAAAGDDRVGVCLVASARNALPLLPADNEREIWADVVRQVERRVDERAEAEWATPNSITVPPMRYEPPQIGSGEITTEKAPRKKLIAGMLASAGPNYADPTQGGVTTNGNQYWPHNQPAQWAYDFGRLSAAAIADTIDATIAGIEVAMPDLAEPFSTLTAAILGHVDDTLKAVSSATAGLQRRTNLLWWREALFSPSAGCSYRDMPVTVAATLMALDLFETVPLFSPASVTAFLGETVLRLPGAGESGSGKHQIADLVREAQHEAALAPLRTAGAILTAVPEGRGPMLALIGHPDHSSAKDRSQFQTLTGIRPAAELDAVTWATWIFRELQASKAATDASAPKRRGGKKS